MSNGSRPKPDTVPLSDLSAFLLAAETTGQLSNEAWPALRQFMVLLAEAQAGGQIEQIVTQIDATAGPLRTLIAAREALEAARRELDVGYAAVKHAGTDPVQIAETAASLAALADDLAARAQQLAALLPH